MKTGKILLLGDGLLGKELAKQNRDWIWLSRKKTDFDINDIRDSIEKEGIHPANDISVIVNCIGYTNTYEDNRKDNWDVNVKFIDSLINFCNYNNIKLVHISTDYLYANSVAFATEEDVPVHIRTWYGYTKLVGDALVQLRCLNWLVIRLSFKSKPYPYDKALTTLWGNFTYVDEASEKISKLIESDACGVYNIGSHIKSMYDLALQTKSDVKKQKLLHPETPRNITMNTMKMQKLFDNSQNK